MRLLQEARRQVSEERKYRAHLMEERKNKAQVKLLRMMMLTNRLLMDEWQLYLYTGHGKGRNDYYRLQVNEDIKQVFKNVKNTYINYGCETSYVAMDNDVADLADDIEDTVNHIRNGIKTNLADKINYDAIDPFARMVMSYIFAVTGKCLMGGNKYGRLFDHLAEEIAEYSERIGIELYQDEKALSGVFTQKACNKLISRMDKMTQKLSVAKHIKR